MPLSEIVVLPVLVAAGLDWLQGLLPVVFVLIWIVSQVMNLFRNAAGKPGGKPPAPPARKPPRPPRPAADPAVDIDREIQEFLARSLKGEKPPPAVKPPAPLPKVRAPARAASAAASSSSGLRRTSRPVDRIGGLAGHGGDVAEHVAAAFAHDLAHELPAASGRGEAAEAASMTDALIASLRSPHGLRQLVLIREVLDRPTHRW